MQEQLQTFAGLETVVVGPPQVAKMAVVLLHGYDMKAEDLAPFVHSMKASALFLLPRGPMETPGGNRAWWHIDQQAKARALMTGPRDLADEYPAGAEAARGQLTEFMSEIGRRYQPQRLVVGGFSQGGMLACDFTLEGSVAIDGLVLLSASRIRSQQWQTRSARLAGLPVLVSHGRMDDDLAFAAGERLRDFAVAAGARVIWVPTEAGHQIPLIVWREFKRFIHALLE